MMEREAEAALGSHNELTAFMDHANNSRLHNKMGTLSVTYKGRILFGQFDAASSSMWMVAIIPPQELHEVTAGYFFRPSPCLTPVGGSQIILPST